MATQTIFELITSCKTDITMTAGTSGSTTRPGTSKPLSLTWVLRVSWRLHMKLLPLLQIASLQAVPLLLKDLLPQVKPQRKKSSVRWVILCGELMYGNRTCSATPTSCAIKYTPNSNGSACVACASGYTSLGGSTLCTKWVNFLNHYFAVDLNLIAFLGWQRKLCR